MREDSRSLVIDGGKSKTAVAIVDEDGQVIATATGPGLAIIGEPGGRDAVARSLVETLGLLGATGAIFHTVVFGLNGVHAPSPDADAAIGLLRGPVRMSRAVVTSDGVLSMVGALGSTAGVAVTAGTGAILLGLGRDDRVHRVDGDGPLLGDRGSGYAVGLAGLREGMRVLDGLAGSAALAEELRREYGTADDAVRVIHSSPTPTRLIAAFSRNVAVAAGAGDVVATGIWRDAAADLARGCAAAAARAGLSDVFPVAFSGGLFGVGDLLVEPLGAELSRICPGAVLGPPAGDAIAGGIAMAMSREPRLTGVSTWME